MYSSQDEKSKSSAQQKKHQRPASKADAFANYIRSLGAQLRWNQFSQSVEVWCPTTNIIKIKNFGEVSVIWRQDAMNRINYDTGDQLKNLNVNQVQTWDAYVGQLARHIQYNPVANYFNSIKGLDTSGIGISIIHEIFDIDYPLMLGVGFKSIKECDEYVAIYSMLFLTNIYRRLMWAGCEYPNMLTLYSALQEIGKTFFLKHLLPPALRHLYWCCDTDVLCGSIDELAMRLAQKSLVEVGEHSMRGKANDRLKRLITSPDIFYRGTYSTSPKDLPRHDVIVATTNDRNPIASDKSGQRRHVIIPLKLKDGKGLTEQAALHKLNSCRDLYFAHAIQNFEEHGGRCGTSGTWVVPRTHPLRKLQEKLAKEFSSSYTHTTWVNSQQTYHN